MNNCINTKKVCIFCKKEFEQILTKRKYTYKESICAPCRYISPQIRIIKSLQVRIWNFRNEDRFKDYDILSILGVPSLEFYFNFLEKQFSFGMSWENYGFGIGKWVVDHIVPVEYFNLIYNVEDYYKCFNYKNTQPLWFIDNIKKNDKMLNGELARHNKTKSISMKCK